jgi:DNA-directed RNA polymerase specialized sigma subunit
VVAVSIDYNVRASRWTHGWELHIDGVGVTQSHNLTAAEDIVRDYIALDLGVEPDSFGVTITPEVGEGLDEDVAAVRRKIREAEQAQLLAAERSRALVRRLAAKGLSGKDIAKVLEVSPQRVSQLLRPKAPGVA